MDPISRSLTLSSSPLLSLGAMLVAHKTGSFLQPPAHPVQHEVKVQDGPSQPQPTMTISRSQSPLPPVDWKTYTSSGRKLRPPAVSSPRPQREQRAGPGVHRETTPLLRYWGGTGQGPFLIWSPHPQRPPQLKIRGAGLPAVRHPSRTSGVQNQKKAPSTFRFIYLHYTSSHFTDEEAEAHKGKRLTQGLSIYFMVQQKQRPSPPKTADL